MAMGPVQWALCVTAARQTAKSAKALPLRLIGTQGLDRAISSAGGLHWSALHADFMLPARPGVFAVCEMLNWEAPAGGYLLQACFNTAMVAARAAHRIRTPRSA